MNETRKEVRYVYKDCKKVLQDEIREANKAANRKMRSDQAKVTAAAQAAAHVKAFSLDLEKKVKQRKTEQIITEMPSNVMEFINCDSAYKIDEKEDSAAISSDGEFDDARNMIVLDDDCTQVFDIDVKKEWQR